MQSIETHENQWLHLKRNYEMNELIVPDGSRFNFRPPVVNRLSENYLQHS